MSKLNERLEARYYNNITAKYPGCKPKPPTEKNYHKHLEQNGDLSWNTVKLNWTRNTN